MGNVYRFVEPVILFLLKKDGPAHGYELSAALNTYALTDAEIERAALYRTLRVLEGAGHVTSSWDVTGRGPARHVYKLTASGEAHLYEWKVVLESLSKSMSRFVEDVDLIDEQTIKT
ncbi:MAG: PadR family transcriptional regulator [Candidatus Aquicultorales bacterium]